MSRHVNNIAPVPTDKSTSMVTENERDSHLHGMAELNAVMRQRSLQLKAFALDNSSAPPVTDDNNVKVIHFVRHGQGFHNLIADICRARDQKWENFSKTPENPYIMSELEDPPLTQKGRNQARKLQPILRDLETTPQLLVSSSHCRALQTAIIAFEQILLSEGKEERRIIAHEMVREHSGVHLCDKLRPLSHSVAEFPTQVDFSLIESEQDEYFNKDVRETNMQVGERIYKFMIWLSNRKEKHIAVTSHSAWLLTLFNGIVECDDSLKAWFETGEMRSVKLVFTKV